MGGEGYVILFAGLHGEFDGYCHQPLSSISTGYFKTLKAYFSQLRIMETRLVSLEGFELCLSNIKQIRVSPVLQSSDKTMFI